MISLFQEQDFIYIFLFALFTAILLFVMIFYANQLRIKAYQNELKAKEDLFSTKSFYKALFENANYSIIVINLKNEILEANQSFLSLFELTSDIIGQYIDKVIYDQSQIFFQSIEKAKLGQSIPAFETSIQTADHSKLIIETTISPILNQKSEVFAVSFIIRDQTEKKLMDEYIRNSEKLKVTGEIAASVAHEIRNPLTVISGFIQMLDERENGFKQYLTIINSELARMNEIISEFLFLSKPHEAQIKKTRLSSIIYEVILLFESEAHYQNVTIIKENIDEDIMVLCNKNQLKQVFINLLKNAFEAMPKGGVVSLSCEVIEDKVRIEVIDSGSGIPEEILKKIKSPFFTTKENGTGLGLMITEQIIEQHNGRFNISNHETKGTRAEIYLPIIIENKLHD